MRNLTAEDERYMWRCIQLARCGEAGASPNPMVGAVVVNKGRIIGEGYHRKCGGPHAEVNAIRSVRQPELLAETPWTFAKRLNFQVKAKSTLQL